MPACGGTLYSNFSTPHPCPTSPHIYFAQFHGNDVKVNDKSMHFAWEGYQTVNENVKKLMGFLRGHFIAISAHPNPVPHPRIFTLLNSMAMEQR